jgi:glycosyltransferase involved in cell wall biosynthesis
MPKLILFVMPNLKIGGGNRVFIELAKQMAEAGYSVRIVCLNNSHEVHTFSVNRNVDVLKIGRPTKNIFQILYNILKMLSVLRREKNGVILISDPLLCILLFPVAARKSTVVRFVQADDYRIYDDLKLLRSRFTLSIYKLMTKLNYLYDKVEYIFNSNYSYNCFLTVSKTNKVPLRLVHPALDHEVFCDMKIRDENKLNICLVARKHPCKGFVDFVRAWQSLGEKILHGIGRVYIMSQDDLSEFDLTDFVLVRPANDSEMAEIYNRAHIFVSTSWWEGFGLPALEAMACGCTVILTDAGGVNEYAVPGQNCLMYKPKNADELREKILLAVNNPNLRNELSRNAMETAKKFSWRRSAGQLENVLKMFENKQDNTHIK